ncbi:MAG: hypothetical protein ACHQ0I_03475 [Candidatus Lutacidiplasmatales archaeon]
MKSGRAAKNLSRQVSFSVGRSPPAGGRGVGADGKAVREVLEEKVIVSHLVRAAGS